MIWGVNVDIANQNFHKLQNRIRMLETKAQSAHALILMLQDRVKKLEAAQDKGKGEMKEVYLPFSPPPQPNPDPSHVHDADKPDPPLGTKIEGYE